MIDLKDFREHPERYETGARAKGIAVDFDRFRALDEERRAILARVESARAEQNRLSREIGPEIGARKGALRKAEGEERARLEREIDELQAKPTRLKDEIQALEATLQRVEPAWRELWLSIPQPPDGDVPLGAGPEENVELRRWNPEGFDPSKSFRENRGFAPRTHLEIAGELGLVDFERGVKIGGSRHYVLTGDGMRLHQAVLRYGFDFITREHGFEPMSVPVVVREEMMTGTGFFPAGREQAYHIEESKRGAGHDLYLTGTGEVGLMGFFAEEILDESQLPRKVATVSTCFRREAGAAGRETAGLYRIHQFDKVEQVVICRADEAESRAWHQTMIGIVESFLQSLELPYRLLQCCTGDLGPKNADMIDLETWMPGRGELDEDGRPAGAYGETHSASRLYDYQCRRLNTRYRDGKGNNVVCHSLNNTVVASPRILIPILEMHQNEDGTVRVPEVLRGYVGREVVGRG